MFLAFLAKQSQQPIDNVQAWMEDNFFFISNFPLKKPSITAMTYVFSGDVLSFDFSGLSTTVSSKSSSEHSSRIC